MLISWVHRYIFSFLATARTVMKVFILNDFYIFFFDSTSAPIGWVYVWFWCSLIYMNHRRIQRSPLAYSLNLLRGGPLTLQRFFVGINEWVLKYFISAVSSMDKAWKGPVMHDSCTWLTFVFQYFSLCGMLVCA